MKKGCSDENVNALVSNPELQSLPEQLPLGDNEQVFLFPKYEPSVNHSPNKTMKAAVKTKRDNPGTFWLQDVFVSQSEPLSPRVGQQQFKAFWGDSLSSFACSDFSWWTGSI